MFFGVCVSCRNLYSFVVYLYINGNGSITSVGEERAYLSAVFTCNYVVSFWGGFIFLWVLGMCYVILLWHSLNLPYNHFVRVVRVCSHVDDFNAPNKCLTAKLLKQGYR